MSEIVETIRSITPKSNNKSVLFITLHRSGSSFCERLLLPSFKGLRHIDYASRIYHGKNPLIIFKKSGFVYGPIRLSAYKKSPVFTKLVQPVCEPDFLKNYSTIFFVRDPRAKILSSYRAFGFSHGSSSNDQIKKIQMRHRLEITNESLEEYARAAVYENKAYYEKMIYMSKHTKKHAFVKYEDMHNDWAAFVDNLRLVVEISSESVELLRKKLRPSKAQVKGGKISLKCSNVDDRVSGSTLEFMNSELGSILDFFGYQK